MTQLVFPEIPLEEVLLEQYRKAEQAANELRYQDAIVALDFLKAGITDEEARQFIDVARNQVETQQTIFINGIQQEYQAAMTLEERAGILDRWKLGVDNENPDLKKARHELEQAVLEKSYLDRWEALDKIISSSSVNFAEIDNAIKEADKLATSIGENHHLYLRVEMAGKDLKDQLEKIRKTQKVDTAATLEEFEDGQKILEGWARENKLTYQDSGGKIQIVAEKLQTTYRARSKFLRDKAEEYIGKAKESLNNGRPGNALENLVRARGYAEGVAGDFRADLNVSEVIKKIEGVQETADAAKKNSDLAVRIRDGIPAKASIRERLAGLRKAQDAYPQLDGIDRLVGNALNALASQVAGEIRGVIANAFLIAAGDYKDATRFERALEELKKTDSLESEVGESASLAMESKDLLSRVHNEVEEARTSILQAGQNWQVFLDQKAALESALGKRPPDTGAAELIFDQMSKELQGLPEISQLRSQLVISQTELPALNQLKESYIAGDYDLVIKESKDKFSKSTADIRQRSERLVAASVLARARHRLDENERKGQYDQALSNLLEMEDACNALLNNPPDPTEEVVTPEQVRSIMAVIPERRDHLNRLAQKGYDLKNQLTRIHQTWTSSRQFNKASDELHTLEEAFSKGSEEEQRFLLPKVQVERVAINNAWRDYYFKMANDAPDQALRNYQMMQELTQANLIRPEDTEQKDKVVYHYWKDLAAQAIEQGGDVPSNIIAARDAYGQIVNLTVATEEDRKNYSIWSRKALTVQVKEEQDPEKAAETLEKEMENRHELRDDFDLQEIVVELWLNAYCYEKARGFVDQTRRYAMLQAQKRADYLSTIIDAHHSFFKPEKTDRPEYVKALSMLQILLDTQAGSLNRTEKIQQLYTDWLDTAVMKLLTKAKQDELNNRFVDAIFSYGLVLELVPQEMPQHANAVERIGQLRSHLDEAATRSAERGDDICKLNPQISANRRLQLFHDLAEEITDYEAELHRLLGVYKAIHQENDQKAQDLQEDQKTWSEVMRLLNQAVRDLEIALKGDWDLDTVSTSLNRAKVVAAKQGKNIIRLDDTIEWVNGLWGDLSTLVNKIEELSNDYRKDQFILVPNDIQTINEQINTLKLKTSQAFQCPDEKIKTQDVYGIPVEKQGVQALHPEEVIGLERHGVILLQKQSNLEMWEKWLNEVDKQSRLLSRAIRDGRGEADAESLLKSIQILENGRGNISKSLQSEVDKCPRLPESMKAYQTVQSRVTNILQDLGMTNVDLHNIQPADLAENCKSQFRQWHDQRIAEIEALLFKTDDDNRETYGCLYDRYKKIYGDPKKYPPEEVLKKNYENGSLADRIQRRCRGYQLSKRKTADVMLRQLADDIRTACMCDRAYQAPCDPQHINDGKKDPSWFQRIFA